MAMLKERSVVLVQVVFLSLILAVAIRTDLMNTSGLRALFLGIWIFAILLPAVIFAVVAIVNNFRYRLGYFVSAVVLTLMAWYLNIYQIGGADGLFGETDIFYRGKWYQDGHPEYESIEAIGNRTFYMIGFVFLVIGTLLFLDTLLQLIKHKKSRSRAQYGYDG